MMNGIQIFTHEKFGEIRTIEIDGEIYFVGVDVATALGYINPHKALKEHVDKDDLTKRYPILDRLGRVQRVNIINESGLYSLILASKLEGAKEFKHWVTSEVLPSIRKTGSYAPKIECSEPQKIEIKNFFLINAEKLKKVKIQNISKGVTLNMFEEVKKNVKITDIVAKYGYQIDRNKKIHCPFHSGDNTASCTVYEDTNTFHCFACNAGGSVIDFVALHDRIDPKEAVEKLCREYGIAVQNNKEVKKSEQAKTVINSREHVYTDENGNILAKKTIYKYSDGSKQCYWNKYDSNIQQYVKGGLRGLKMPLYHADRLKTADIVYIAEGEKDVETLEKMGYTATSSPNGAGQAWKDEFNKYLIGKKCVILTDNDDSGEKAGIKTTEILVKDGISCKLIRAIDIYKDVKTKGDITDIVEEVGTEKALDLLRTAVNNTDYCTPASTEQAVKLPEWIKETPKGLRVNAELLSKYIQENANYFLVQQKDQESQRFFWYENGVYSRISAKIVKSKIRDIISPFGVELAKVRVIEDTYTHLTYPNAKHYISDENILDSDENIINFQNGILCLDTMELKPHNPRYISTIQIPCNWNPIEKPAPTFQKYIRHLANDDEDTVKTLLEIIGFILSNIKIERFKQALMLIGQGNSGKSKFLELMQLLIGTENYCAMPFERLDKRFSASTLYKKRLAADDDCNYCSFSNISTFKQITGGGPLQNEEKGKQAFTFIYHGLYVICANSLPLFGGDKGLHVYDRILPIQCGSSIPRHEQDKNLLEKLYAEREQIILLAIVHLQNAIKNNYNFTVSAASSRLLNEYMKENDIVFQFIDECCTPRTKKDNVTTKVLYEAFRTWCEQNGEKYIPKKTEFTESICRYYKVDPKDKAKIIIKSNSKYYTLTLTANAKKELHSGYDNI